MPECGDGVDGEDSKRAKMGPNTEKLLQRMSDMSADKAAKAVLDQVRPIAVAAAKEAAQEVVAPVVSEFTEMKREWKLMMDARAFEGGSDAASTVSLVSSVPTPNRGRPNPQSLEVKGFIVDWKDPDASAMLASDAKTLVDKIIGWAPDCIDQDLKTFIDPVRTEKNIDSRVFQYKVVVFVKPNTPRKAI